MTQVLIRALIALTLGSQLVASTSLVASCAKPRPTQLPTPSGPLSAPAYAHYLRGRLAVEARDFPTAVLQFRAAQAAAPHQPQIRVALIEALLSARQHSAAREAGADARKRFPGSSVVWLASARASTVSNKLRDATRMLKRAIKLDDENEPAYLLLADVWRKRKRPENVERSYRRLLAQKPRSTEGNYRLASHLLERGKYALVEPLLRTVIADKPELLRAWVNLARSQRARGRTGSARKTLQRAFDRSNGDASVADDLLRQLLDKADRRFAVQMLHAIDRNDLNADTRISIGYLFIHAGEAGAAVRLAEEIMRQTTRGEVQILKATALISLKRSQEALRILLRIPTADTTFAEARADAVEVLARAGSFTRALAVVLAARKKKPKDVELLIAQALTLELSGDAKAARQLFTGALLAQPKNVTLRLAFGSMEERQKRPHVAVRLVAPILDDNPNDTQALNFIAYSLADRGIEFPRAERLLRKALRLAPMDGYILDSYGWLQFRRRKLGAAEKLLSRAVRLAPAEPEILWHLAELYLHRKQRRKALRLLTKAQKLRPEGRVKQRIEARIQALRSH